MSTLPTLLVRSWLVVVMIFFFSGSGLYGQSFIVSETSSKFVNENDYDSLVRSIALPVARKNHVSENEFQTRYDSNRERLMEPLKLLLQSGFSVLDNTYEGTKLVRGAPGYSKARLSYLERAGEMIQAMVNETNLFSVLFYKDYNDRILDFHVDITVRPSGDLEISELITIFNGNGQANTDNEGNNSSYVNDDIQRGIIRDFPINYIDKNGFWSNVGFEIKGVFRNGEPEPYSLESLKNGKRIRVGRADYMLPQGNYTYKIDYETNRQLIFHPDKDELYWNVTGSGWVFTIDSASCLVHFPKGAFIKEHACYTGSQGSKDRSCSFNMVDDHTIFFSTSKLLDSYQGFTIAASIQKGILLAPGKTDQLIAFLKTNFIIPALSLLLIFLILFYFIVWYRKGRDPKEGVIYPRFSPPPGLTPPDVGYIMKQGFGSHLFAAALIDLAVKKYLEIEVKREGLIIKSPAYYLKCPAHIDQGPDIVDSYGFNINRLYGLVIKKNKYEINLETCYNNLRDTLEERFLIRKGKPNSWNGLFALNRSYTIFGGILLVCGVILSIGFIISHPSWILSIITVLLLVALFVLHIVFVKIISAYTRQGRDIADHILGFRMYLDQAEQRVYEELTPPEKTLELFEKYLPYAIALKVENSWAEKFDDILQKAIADGYQPTYYLGTSGGLNSFSMYSMSHEISSGLSSSVSSASTPPSSSDGGSDGGGSSGGGGGGGGGGGW